MKFCLTGIIPFSRINNKEHIRIQKFQLIFEQALRPSLLLHFISYFTPLKCPIPPEAEHAKYAFFCYLLLQAAMNKIRKELEGIPGLQYKFDRPTYFSFKTPIEVEVAGYDLDVLKKISGDIVQRMRSIDRFTDIKSSMELGHPEVQIYFDRERAAALGLNVYEVADRVVKKVRGEVATRYAWHDRKIDVLVRIQEQDRASVKNIQDLIINTQSDKPILLKAVAEIVT